MTKKRIFLRSAAILFCVFLLFCTVIFPAEAAESITGSLSLAVRRVVPSLFAFSALAALFARIGLFTRAGRLGRLFGLSPACAAVADCSAAFPQAPYMPMRYGKAERRTPRKCAQFSPFAVMPAWLLSSEP